MSIDIVRGSTTKHVAAEYLEIDLKSQSNWNGRLFIGYPIVRSSNESHSIDALWVSPDIGVIAFDLIEGSRLEDYKERQDDIANKLEIQLRGELGLVKQRQLVVPIFVVSYSPTTRSEDKNEQYPVLNSTSLKAHVRKIHSNSAFESILYEPTLSVLENVSRLNKRKKARSTNVAKSRGS